ncbi:MAG: hypothetical protein ABI629_13160 [bacterium]
MDVMPHDPLTEEEPPETPARMPEEEPPGPDPVSIDEPDPPSPAGDPPTTHPPIEL